MIDWSFITSVENAPPPERRKPAGKNSEGEVPVDPSQNKSFLFDEAIFEDAVVMPSYRYLGYVFCAAFSVWR